MSLEIKYFKYPKLIKLLLMVYIIGFAVGTTTHSIELIDGGFFPYTFAPLWKNIYRTSLTFLDFAVIILILISIRPALIIAVIIIVSDVIINSGGFDFYKFDIVENYRLVFQFIFGLYILVTAPIIMINYKRNLKTNHMHTTFYKFHGGFSGMPKAAFRMFSLSVCGLEIARNPPLLIVFRWMQV